MTAGELAWMREVSQRYAYPGVMLRYALAAGLNGEPGTAEAVLRSLCHMHPRERCVELHDAWRELLIKYPSLQTIRLPPRPETAGTVAG
jgi:hypothetical protein